MLFIFIILQSILFLFMILHDWISIPPLNNIAELKGVDSDAQRLWGSMMNGFFVLVPLILTLLYYKSPFIPAWAMVTIISFYLGLTIGTIMSWWVPYFLGSSAKLKQAFKKFQPTHHFLPARGDNIIPNTLHVILHLQVWTCLVFAIIIALQQ